MKKIKLRPNQQKAVDNLLACFLGQDIEPTGNGKSLIALECYRRIKEERKVSTWGVIFVHRILLAKQWIKIAARYLIGQHNMKLHFLNINSSKLSRKVTDDIEKCMYDAFGPGAPGILSTTNPDDVRTRLQTLTEKGYSVIVVCTYHSAEVLEKAKVNFNLKIFDEAPEAVE